MNQDIIKSEEEKDTTRMYKIRIFVKEVFRDALIVSAVIGIIIIFSLVAGGLA